MQLTPFEKAERNRHIHIKRMAMTEKVSQMVQQLKEGQSFLAAAEDPDLEDCYGMYDPVIVDTVKREVKTITSALVIMADAWESIAGVSA
jgi:hypothetical protein